ncbi:uncharacterized protein LOC117294660 [Asterias rubens]|uniref:uncharacterized protein LOC117294660 n=1 Tax=Asterias rubens TaxID=7604 RepID=UPI00145501D7|nr:uncharacterized protein LOC117294660 [Asterias rubens]
MRELRAIHKLTYDSYKLSRFDPDMMVSNYDVDGMPSLSNISNADRFFMTEKNLLTLHSANLRAFQQLIFFVKIDENMSAAVPDFGPQFAVIEARLSRVGAGILAVMGHLDFMQDGVPENAPASMGPQSNSALRNIRDLFVLQEMYSYLAIAEYDLNRRMAVHQTQAAADQ